MLRKPLAIVLSLGCLGSTGCSVWRYARLVQITERKEFCEEADDEISMATYRSWADEAWAETGACCPDNCTAADYAWGFREGFAQYVYAGGSGEPPATPPRPYWQTDLRTPEGAAAVRSWFEGYRHGARIARECGYRRATTLRLSASMKDCDACGCPDDGYGTAAHSEAIPAGPALGTPAAMAAPSEVIVPLPEPAEEEELSLPSFDESPAESSMPSPELEPLGGRSTDGGRVRTALFQIVR